jgi:hypothetical protein
VFDIQSTICRFLFPSLHSSSPLLFFQANFPHLIFSLFLILFTQTHTLSLSLPHSPPPHTRTHTQPIFIIGKRIDDIKGYYFTLLDEKESTTITPILETLLAKRSASGIAPTPQKVKNILIFLSMLLTLFLFLFLSSDLNLVLSYDCVKIEFSRIYFLICFTHLYLFVYFCV